MNVVEITVKAKDSASGALGGIGNALAPLKEKVSGMLVPLAKMGVALGAVASTAISAAPLLVPVGAALFAVGQAAVAAAPALIAFKVAGVFVSQTMTAIFKEGSAAQKALEPLKKGFEQAGEAASKAAAAGIKPMAEQLNRITMPHIREAMVGIGEATNKVMRGFLGWAATKDGVSSIRGALMPISRMMNDLTPEITRVAISFVQLMGRIMGVSMAAGETGLSGVLTKVADVMDRINADSVRGGMTKLKDSFNAVVDAGRVVVGWIRKITEAYKMYTTEFIVVADAVSLLAIAFGGPVIAIVAGIGLVIRHFDEFKAGWEGLKEAFSGGGGDGPLSGFMDNMKAFSDEVLPHLKEAFEEIKEAVAPVLEEIADKVQNKLIPAFGEFVEAVGPVVSWLVDILGPAVAKTFKNLFKIISGAIDIIVGVFKIFTAIIKGDWSLAWEGIQDILKGAWKIIKALLDQLWNMVTSIFTAGRDVVVAIWERLFEIVSSVAKQGMKNAANAIRGLGELFGNVGGWLRDKLVAPFKSAGSWLVNVGRNMVAGLANGISAVGGWVMGAIRAIIPDFLEQWIPGFASGGISSGGLAMVGERGRELVRLPTGSQVVPNGQTEALMASGGGGGGGSIAITLMIGSETIGELVIDPLRKIVRNQGGDVQAVLGA